MSSPLSLIRTKNKLIGLAIVLLLIHLVTTYGIHLSYKLYLFLQRYLHLYRSGENSFYGFIIFSFLLTAIAWLYALHKKKPIGIILLTLFSTFIAFDNFYLCIYDVYYLASADHLKFYNGYSSIFRLFYLALLTYTLLSLGRNFYTARFNLSKTDLTLTLLTALLVRLLLLDLSVLTLDYSLYKLLAIGLCALGLMIYLLIKEIKTILQFQKGHYPNFRLALYFSIKSKIIILPFLAFALVSIFILTPLLGHGVIMSDLWFGQMNYPFASDYYGIASNINYIIPAALSYLLFNYSKRKNHMINSFKTDIYWSIVLFYLLLIIFQVISSF